MIKIALVDDHNIFRAGLKALILNKPDISIHLECSDGREFLEKLSADIDMVLMDLPSSLNPMLHIWTAIPSIAVLRPFITTGTSLCG